MDKNGNKDRYRLRFLYLLHNHSSEGSLVRVAAYDNPLVTGASSWIMRLLMVIGMLSTLRLDMLRMLRMRRILRLLRMGVMLRTL